MLFLWVAHTVLCVAEDWNLRKQKDDKFVVLKWSNVGVCVDWLGWEEWLIKILDVRWVWEKRELIKLIGVAWTCVLGTLDLGLTTQHRMVDKIYDIIGLSSIYLLSTFTN